MIAAAGMGQWEVAGAVVYDVWGWGSAGPPAWEGLGRGIPPGLGYPQSHHLAPVGGDDGETPTLYTA